MCFKVFVIFQSHLGTVMTAAGGGGGKADESGQLCEACSDAAAACENGLFYEYGVAVPVATAKEILPRQIEYLLSGRN